VVTDRLGLLVTPLAAGFAAQVVLGAMSFLVPVVLGGGPAIVRGTQARLELATPCVPCSSTPGS
jgi:nitrite reductase (NO-forming)